MPVKWYPAVTVARELAFGQVTGDPTTDAEPG
jgi:hypothetical protein